MPLKRSMPGLIFCCFFVVSYFSNKYVLSVLKFTFPTLFQGWQTFVGGLLLLVSGKLGWVEINNFSRSAALSWLPASLLFVGNIYGGSRALSRLVSDSVPTSILSVCFWCQLSAFHSMIHSVLLLAFAAHPTGDLFAAMEFPFLMSYKFHSGCCASALLGFLLLLATVKLKSVLPVEHCGAWVFLA
ncbi:hypothetical protein JZ751_015774, partial [Albula glossodonta]